MNPSVAAGAPPAVGFAADLRTARSPVASDPRVGRSPVAAGASPAVGLAADLRTARRNPIAAASSSDHPRNDTLQRTTTC